VVATSKVAAKKNAVTLVINPPLAKVSNRSWVGLQRETSLIDTVRVSLLLDISNTERFIGKITNYS